MANSSASPSLNIRRKKTSSVNASNRAFVIEALILLAFLAVSVAIILQLFAAAGVQSREAHKLSMSEHLATNMAESFAANPKSVPSIVYYDKDGNPVDEQRQATYSVESEVVPQRTEAGTLYSVHITVTNYELRYDGNVLYELDTKRYLSALDGGGM
ncbi:MAG: hypothetical protein IJ113_08190 [Eggerthellaceae bacterium]|nr:hypothetical protein [Eggerthellaceae bacterium]